MRDNVPGKIFQNLDENARFYRPEYNVTVNVVPPGKVNTDMIPGTIEDRVAFAHANIPARRCRDDHPGPELIGDVVSSADGELPSA